MKMQWVCHDHCDGIAGGYPSCPELLRRAVNTMDRL